MRAKKIFISLCEFVWYSFVAIYRGKQARNSVCSSSVFGQTRSYGVFMTRFVRLRAMWTFYFGIMTTFRWPLIRSRIYQEYTSAKRAKTQISSTTTYERIILSRFTPLVCSFASSIKMIHAGTETNPFKPGAIMKLALVVDVGRVVTQFAWLFVCATIWRPNPTERTLKREKKWSQVPLFRSN